MPCSPAQLEANRRNGSLSKGPVTSTGREASRRNSLKHGLTGGGSVVHDEDAAEVERRFAEFEQDLKPTSAVERELVGRVALMSVRMRRAADHEAAAIADRMRHAVERYDEARTAEADHLLAWIASAPETNARLLRKTPEGIERLIAAVQALRADLARPGGFRWDYDHCDRLHHYIGRRYTDIPVSRIRALTEAIHGRFEYLKGDEGVGETVDDRRRWAIAQLVYLMDDEVTALKAQLEGFDREALERERSEAPARAMFDDSKGAILARKYEAASERGFFKALKELRELRAGSTQIETSEQIAPETAEELGSFSPDAPGESTAEPDVDPTSTIEASPATRKRPVLAKRARKGRRRGGNG